MLGLIVLSTIGLVVISVSFAALVWAAVQDGRDDANIRGPAPHATVEAVRVVPAKARPRYAGRPAAGFAL